MVNSDDPSNDRVSLQSHYSRHKASQEPQPPSEQPATSNFFPARFFDNPNYSAWTLHQDPRSLLTPLVEESLKTGILHATTRLASFPVAGLHHLSRLQPIYKPKYLVFLSDPYMTLFCPFFSPTTYTFSFFLIFLLSPTPLKLLSPSGAVLFLLKVLVLLISVTLY